MNTTTLSFSLRPARDWNDLLEAAQVRSLSYGHHMPTLQLRLLEPDEADTESSTTVLLAHDKRSGDPIGTARMQVSTRGTLLIDQCIAVPPDMAGHSRAEITRLAAVPGCDPMVKLALMKASYLYCLANQSRWMTIGARNEALIRQYRRLGFVDLAEDGAMQPLSYAANLPHRILKFDVTGAERSWGSRGHPLYSFMVDTIHPDIQLFPWSAISRSRETSAA